MVVNELRWLAGGWERTYGKKGCDIEAQEIVGEVNEVADAGCERGTI